MDKDDEDIRPEVFIPSKAVDNPPTIKASLCFGNYLESEAACVVCQIARYCEKATDRIKK
jgi:hypothetical protein